MACVRDRALGCLGGAVATSRSRKNFVRTFFAFVVSEQ